MGIRLDWEIEAEQTQMHNGGEDPFAARVRRRARLRFHLILAVFLAIIGAVALAINWRLQEVDAEIEQLLRDTVGAEVAALRIGDYQAFADIQRSGAESWLISQQQPGCYTDHCQRQSEENDYRVAQRIEKNDRNEEHGSECYRDVGHKLTVCLDVFLVFSAPFQSVPCRQIDGFDRLTQSAKKRIGRSVHLLA